MPNVLIPGATPVVGGSVGQALTVGAGGTLATASVATASAQTATASQLGCTLYASLSAAKTAAAGGADDSAKLQGFLGASNATAPVTLVIDGIVIGSVALRSNTTLSGVGGAVLLSPGGATANQLGPVTNANWSSGTITDQNITVRDLVIDGNRAAGHGNADLRLNSAGVFLSNLMMFGVSNLVLENVHCQDMAGYGVHVANATGVDAKNIRIDAVPGSQNGDGFHADGPASEVTVRNVRGFSTDDMVSICADAPSGTYTGLPIAYGPITDVLIEGVYLENAWSAVRLLSNTNLLDGVTIRTVRGNYYFAGVLMDYFTMGGPGNFGAVTIEDVELSPVLIAVAQNNFSGNPTQHIKVNGNTRTARFSNVRRSAWAYDFPMIEAAGGAIGSLRVDSCHAAEASVAASPLALVSGGTLARLTAVGNSVKNLPAVVSHTGGSLASVVGSGNTTDTHSGAGVALSSSAVGEVVWTGFGRGGSSASAVRQSSAQALWLVLDAAGTGTPPGAGGGTLTPLPFSDSFTGASSTPLTTHNPAYTIFNPSNQLILNGSGSLECVTAGSGGGNWGAGGDTETIDHTVTWAGVPPVPAGGDNTIINLCARMLAANGQVANGVILNIYTNDSGASSKMDLYECVAGSFTLAASGVPGITSGSAHTIALKVDSSHNVTVSVDGVHVPALDHAITSSALKAGGCTFVGWMVESTTHDLGGAAWATNFGVTSP